LDDEETPSVHLDQLSVAWATNHRENQSFLFGYHSKVLASEIQIGCTDQFTDSKFIYQEHFYRNHRPDAVERDQSCGKQWNYEKASRKPPHRFDGYLDDLVHGWCSVKT